MDERNSPSRTATPDEEAVVLIDDMVEPDCVIELSTGSITPA